MKQTCLCESMICDVVMNSDVHAGVEPLLLDTQYRMHPRIAEIPSELFYNKRLKSGTLRELRLAQYEASCSQVRCGLSLHSVLPVLLRAGQRGTTGTVTFHNNCFFGPIIK